jgi:hypothetical protein
MVAADVWVEAKDPKSGKTYYFNKATKKTQWAKPTSMDMALTPTDAANWKVGEDKKSGKSYYYNKATKQTTWKRPECMGATEAAPKQDESKKEEIKKVVALVVDTGVKQEESKKEEVKQAAALMVELCAKQGEWKKEEIKQAVSLVVDTSVPDLWKQAKDPRTGKTYWYNKGTKKTTWKDPFGEDEKPVLSKKEVEESPSNLIVDDGNSDEDSGEGFTVMVAPMAAKMVPSDNGDAKDKKGVSPQAQLVKVVGDDNDENDDEKDGQELGEDEDGLDFKFAKHRKGWWNRTFKTGEVHDESQLLTFKKSMIKKSLLKQNRDLDEASLQSFKNVMSYMGDRKSSKPPVDHAKKLLRELMQQPSTLRDEVYMQLCKQTTQNPKIASTIKGWELMVFCMATFPPSKHLKSFLLDFLDKHENDPQSKIKQLAKTCQKQLPKIVLMGQRKQIPSKLELEALIEMKSVSIRVLLANGSSKLFMVDSNTTVKEVEEMLVQKYNLTCSQPFALFEQAEKNEERILDPKDRILDVMASWENRRTSKELEAEALQNKTKASARGTKFDKHKDADKTVAVQQIQYRDYLYKAKLVLKTETKEIMADTEAINLIYIQAVADVITSRYPSNEKDITVLAALQLQATFGNYSSAAHVPGWLAPKISEFIPRHLLAEKGDKVQDHLVKEWELKVLAKYQKVADFTSLDAKLNYLDYVQEWVFYGAQFFTVEQRQFKDYPSPLTLGINSVGVLLMHPEKKTVLENYKYTDIVTWGHSDEKFIVVVGNIVQQRKLIFKTAEGKIMNHLIHDYVKFKVKGK